MKPVQQKHNTIFRLTAILLTFVMVFIASSELLESFTDSDCGSHCEEECSDLCDCLHCSRTIQPVNLDSYNLSILFQRSDSENMRDALTLEKPLLFEIDHPPKSFL